MTNLQLIIIAKLKIFTYVVGDIIRSIKGSALMGAFIQCFCLVDYLSYIAKLANNEVNNENYIAFINKYLSQSNAILLFSYDAGRAGSLLKNL